MKNILLTITLLALMFISCEKDNTDINNGQLIIEMGSICGWCAPGDTLFMTKTNTKYQLIFPCGGTNIEVEETTKSNDWDNLIGLLDREKFSEIDLNTCYYCADGCDIWIKITDENYSHIIRYGYEDTTALETIKPFVDKLDNIRLGYRD